MREMASTTSMRGHSPRLDILLEDLLKLLVPRRCVQSLAARFPAEPCRSHLYSSSVVAAMRQLPFTGCYKRP